MSSRSASTSVLLLAAILGFAAVGCRTGDAGGATLVVRAPAEDADASVFVDGNYVGRLRDLSNGELPPIQLAPGVHRLEVRKPGRFPVQRTLTVEKGGPSQLVVDAELLEDPA